MTDYNFYYNDFNTYTDAIKSDYASGYWRSQGVKEAVFKKDETAFNSGDGICYTDNEGATYSRKDLICLAGSTDGAEYMFKSINGETPEGFMDDSWSFIKCERCGRWRYNASASLLHHKDTPCPFCSPIRTNGKIKLTGDPYDDDRMFWKKKKIQLRPGLTSVIGCNGIGKSTLFANIKNELGGKGVPFIMFDNLGTKGGQGSVYTLLSAAVGGFKGEVADDYANLDYALSVWSSSEGERIAAAMERFKHDIIDKMFEYADYGEFWILLDALDSGLSVDMIEIIRENMLRPLLSGGPDGMEIYILISSNSYELSENTDCFSLARCKYVNIRNYQSFCKEIRYSRDYKRQRDEIFFIKNKISHAGYDFSFNEYLAEKYGSIHSGSKITGVVASLAGADFKIEMVVNITRNESNSRFRVYKRQADGDFVNYILPKSINVPQIDFHIREKDAKSDLLSLMTDIVYHDKYKKKKRESQKTE